MLLKGIGGTFQKKLFKTTLFGQSVWIEDKDKMFLMFVFAISTSESYYVFYRLHIFSYSYNNSKLYSIFL